MDKTQAWQQLASDTTIHGRILQAEEGMVNWSAVIDSIICSERDVRVNFTTSRARDLITNTVFTDTINNVNFLMDVAGTPHWEQDGSIRVSLPVMGAHYTILPTEKSEGYRQRHFENAQEIVSESAPIRQYAEVAIFIVAKGMAFVQVNPDNRVLCWRMSDYDNSAQEICQSIEQMRKTYQEARLIFPTITVVGENITPADHWRLTRTGAHVYGYIDNPIHANRDEVELIKQIYRDLQT